MYAIEFSQAAFKEFQKLPFDIRVRIVKALERIRTRPFAFVTRLENSNYYRLRVGDYRVIIDIQENKLIVFVIKVGHRSNIYDRRI